jgi:hypothetical protein
MSLIASRQNGLDDLRATTLAFIADDPVTLVLVPGKAVAVEGADGGYDYSDGVARDPQDFKVIGEFGIGDGKADSESGAVAKSFTYTMIGAHDAEVEIGDYWVDGGNRYTVTSKIIENGYETRIVVNSQGTEPNYG